MVKNLSLIGALALLLGLQLVGMLISQWAGIPIPGTVIGLVILFVMLTLLGPPPESLARTSDTLIDHLALLFVPAGVGIIEHLETLEGHGLAVIVTLVASAMATVMVTAVTFAGVSRLIARR